MTEGKGTILIVDDELSIRRVLKEILNSKGFEAQAGPAGRGRGPGSGHAIAGSGSGHAKAGSGGLGVGPR